MAIDEREPDRLKKGKEKHLSIQQEWLDEAEGEVTKEHGITKPNGRSGRIDVHVEADDVLTAVVEIKDSDWDAMTPKAVRRNAKRYARQLWDYIEAELAAGHEVSPGIEFTRMPSDIARMELIEALFDERGIPVVWNNESSEEQKYRKSST